jgi:SAM-dependent methyltransferase
MSWSGRLRREIPILTDVLGPPGDGGLLDAGCGTGHHVIALSQLGYKVVGADISAEMLEIAGKHAAEKAGGEFDGLFCLANSLTCSGTAGAVAEALEQFARCLRPGGRFYIETLNFTPMLPPGTVGGMLVQPTAPTAAGPTAQASVKTNGSGDSTDVATDGDAEVEAEGGEDRDGPEAFLLDPSSTQVSKLYIGGDDEPSPSARKQKYRLYPVSNTVLYLTRSPLTGWPFLLAEPVSVVSDGSKTLMCLVSCSPRSWSKSSGSVCRRRWCSVGDTATEREVGNSWEQRLMLRGNEPESLSLRRQGQGFHDGAARQARITASRAALA